MGYETTYEGTLGFNRRLGKAEKAFLESMSGDLVEIGSTGVLLSFELDDDDEGIIWESRDNGSHAIAALNYITDEMRSKFPEFSFTGELKAQGDNWGDHWILRIDKDGKAYRYDPKCE